MPKGQPDAKLGGGGLGEGIRNAEGDPEGKQKKGKECDDSYSIDLLFDVSTEMYPREDGQRRTFPGDWKQKEKTAKKIGGLRRDQELTALNEVDAGTQSRGPFAKLSNWSFWTRGS